MLIAIFWWLKHVGLPMLVLYANALMEPALITIIVCSGIFMLLGAVGMRVSENFGSTILSGVFRAIGFIFVTLVLALGWLFRGILRLAPRIYTGSRRTFIQSGMNPIASSLMAVVVVTVFVAVII